MSSHRTPYNYQTRNRTLNDQADIAPATKRGYVKPIALLCIVGGLLVLTHFLPITEWVRDGLAWVDGLGVWGPVALVVLYILATVLFVPGVLLTFGAGILFGLVKGGIAVSIGSTLGATAAFLVGRYFARDAVAQSIEGNAKFEAIDRAVANEGWKIVGLTRLSPIFPFNLLNYAYGVTNVSLRDYFFASWIGMMPGTVLYVYIGTAIGSLADLGEGGRERTTTEWVFYGVGLLATVIVTVFITKIARKALAEAIDEPPETE